MKTIETICVCGAGTMGSGIAQVAAQAGYRTIQFDLNPEMLEKSRKSITAQLDRLLEKQRITGEEHAQTLRNLFFTDQLSACKADLVIEAIVEKLEAKTALFQSLAAQNDADCILATNTSSIPVTAIAAAVPSPQRVVGMHFFNPAPLMKLVEVIKGDATNQATIDTVMAVSRNMKKSPVLCKDAPGFIVNRVARHFYLESMYLVENEQASFEEIDQLLEASGFKMGPFKLMDLIGMDINYGVSNIVWEALGKPERLTPSSIQKAKVDAGHLGRKTGKGFYDY